jgi:uncharacterized phage protein (TIGR02218 family)
MKSASQELITHLAKVIRADAPMIYADLYTFALITGHVLQYSTADIPVTVNGATFQAKSVLVKGLLYKASIGLNVDQQQITIYADESDLIAGGIPFMAAMRRGMFDGARLKRERAFFTAWSQPAVGAVTLFKGIVSTIDAIGRTEAQLTVSSDLTYLDITLPRSTYQTTCLHTLYDSGCGLDKSLFMARGTAEIGSIKIALMWSGANVIYQQGRIMFLSGANGGSSATVRKISGSVMLLSYPLPELPAIGDSFSIYQGCDHTQSTCTNTFNNLANFRAFPYVPQAQTAI